MIVYGNGYFSHKRSYRTPPTFQVGGCGIYETNSSGETCATLLPCTRRRISARNLAWICRENNWLCVIQKKHLHVSLSVCCLARAVLMYQSQLCCIFIIGNCESINNHWVVHSMWLTVSERLLLEETHVHKIVSWQALLYLGGFQTFWTIIRWTHRWDSLKSILVGFWRCRSWRRFIW